MAYATPNIESTMASNTMASKIDAREFEALFNNAIIGIILSNQDGEIMLMNRFAEDQFGYECHELVGKLIELLIPPNFRGHHAAHRQHFYRHPQTRMMGEGRDLHALRKDGTEFPAEVSLSHYELGGKNYVISFVADITLRKKGEESLRLHNEELEKMVHERTRSLQDAFLSLEKSDTELKIAYDREKELGEMKSRFVSMASHEFRTPLSTILSSINLIRRYAGAEEGDNRERHVVKIQNAVRNLNSILEDFLSLGKLEEGLVITNPELLTKSHLLTEIDDLLQEMGQASGRQQSLTLGHSLIQDHFSVDKKLLRNIMINLVSNAMKYSPDGSVISVQCSDETGELQISVTDKGIGISEDEQVRLFDRFFRASNAGKVAGTGLGLHIVRRYLDLIGGHVSLNSKLNEGTRVIIYFPQTPNAAI